jgi:hypothetical protein
MKAYGGVEAVLRHNTDILKSASTAEKTAILVREFRRFRDTELRRADPSLKYRIHWSGDVFDLSYAKALVSAMNCFPDILFWTYTRSFFSVSTLLLASNLKLYLSCDPDNLQTALRTYFNCLKHFPNDRLQLAWMHPEADAWDAAYASALDKEKEQHARYGVLADDWFIRTDPEAWAETPPRLGTCPVDVGRLPLEGGCDTCQKCLGTRRPLMSIWFQS